MHACFISETLHETGSKEQNIFFIVMERFISIQKMRNLGEFSKRKCSVLSIFAIAAKLASREVVFLRLLISHAILD